MRTLRRIVNRFLGFFTGTSREDDLAAELQSHIDMQTEDNFRLGMSREEAHRAAVLKFGGVETTKESYRDQRSLPQLEALWMDLRFAGKSFSRRPGLVTVAVLSLALGIGATTTIFTWFKAVYLDPMPGVKDARHLVTINGQYKDWGGMSESYAHFQYIRDHCPAFAGLFAHEMRDLAFGDGKAVDLTTGGIVSGNYFQVLGVEMAAGRPFRPEEDEVPDRDAVLVLGYDLWQQRFGGDPTVLGRRVELNRVPFTVIGVAPPGFAGVYGGMRQDYWFPMHMAHALSPSHSDPLASGSWLQIMGRPRPGVTVDQIQASLDVLSPQIRALAPSTKSSYQARAFPLHEAQRGYHSGIFTTVEVLGVAAGIVLFLAWLNVANLLIAAASDRAREMAVRVSLGAGRVRILRQLLTENFLLALLGGVCGWLVAVYAHGLIGAVAGTDAHLSFNTGLDLRVLLFCTAAALLSAIIFGMLPAFEAGRVNLADCLKEGATATTASRRRSLMRSVLVIGQMALSMAAVAGAVLFAQYLLRIAGVNRGFRTDHILTAQTNYFAAGLDEARGQTLCRVVVDRLQTHPEVASVAWTSFLPGSGSGGSNSRPLKVPGFEPPDGETQTVVVDSASPGYLQTLGIPLLAGREFNWSDDAKAPLVTMVNEEFVTRYLAGRNPIGQPVEIGGKQRAIVGVYHNYVYRHPSASTDPSVFLPMPQDYDTRPTLVIHTRAEPMRLVADVRSIIQGFDSHLPVAGVMTMQQNLDLQTVDSRFTLWILVVFGLATSILAAIGLHGTLSAFFNQRRRELGIRLALGATPGDLRRLVVLRSMRLTIVGVVFGLGLSFLFARVLNAVLWKFTPLNMPACLLAAAGATLVAAISTYAPLRRVVRTDPMVTLRYE